MPAKKKTATRKVARKTASKPPTKARKATKKPSARKAATGKTTLKKAVKRTAKKKSPANKVASKKASSKKAVKKAAKKKAAKKKAATKKAATKKPLPKAKLPSAKPTVTVKKSKPKKLTKRDAAFFLERLIAQRERLVQQVHTLKGESLQRNDVVTTEDGTDVFDRQFALTLASSEQAAINDIDDALRRLEEGSYGICEECGCQIEAPRLKALPFVRMCITCQSERESNGRRFRPVL